MPAFRIRWLLLGVVVLLPILAWAFVTPLRMLAPEFHGMHCTDAVCGEHLAAMDRASELFSTGMVEVARIGIAPRRPGRFIYCSTARCYETFGGGQERAISYPFLGTVVAPGSWQVHITQHELIHWAQFENLGSVQTMWAPEWLREGMAYFFSGAPANDIPAHYLPMIEQYEARHGEKGWTEVWLAASRL